MSTYFKILLGLAQPLALLLITLLCEAQWYTMLLFPLLLHVQNRYAIICLDNSYLWLCKNRITTVIVEVVCLLIIMVTAVMAFYVTNKLFGYFYIAFIIEVGVFAPILLPLLLCAHFGKSLHIRYSYLPGEQVFNNWLLRVREHRKMLLAVVIITMLAIIMLYVCEKNVGDILPQWGLVLILCTKKVLCILNPLICMLMYMALLVKYELPDGIILAIEDSAHVSMMGCLLVTMVCWVLM